MPPTGSGPVFGSAPPVAPAPQGLPGFDSSPAPASNLPPAGVPTQTGPSGVPTQAPPTTTLSPATQPGPATPSTVQPGTTAPSTVQPGGTGTTVGPTAQPVGTQQNPPTGTPAQPGAVPPPAQSGVPTTAALVTGPAAAPPATTPGGINVATPGDNNVSPTGTPPTGPAFAPRPAAPATPSPSASPASTPASSPPSSPTGPVPVSGMPTADIDDLGDALQDFHLSDPAQDPVTTESDVSTTSDVEMTEAPPAEPVSTTTESPVDGPATTDQPAAPAPTPGSPGLATPQEPATAQPTPGPAPVPTATPNPAPQPAISVAAQQIAQANQIGRGNLSPADQAAYDQALLNLIDNVSAKPYPNAPAVVAANSSPNVDLSTEHAVVLDSLAPNLSAVNPNRSASDTNCHLVVQHVDRMFGGETPTPAPKVPTTKNLNSIVLGIGKGKFSPPGSLESTLQTIGTYPPGARGVLAWSFDPKPGQTEPQTGHVVNVVTTPGGHVVLIDGQSGELATLPPATDNPKYQFMPTTHAPVAPPASNPVPAAAPQPGSNSQAQVPQSEPAFGAQPPAAPSAQNPAFQNRSQTISITRMVPDARSPGGVRPETTQENSINDQNYRAVRDQLIRNNAAMGFVVNMTAPASDAARLPDVIQSIRNGLAPNTSVAFVVGFNTTSNDVDATLTNAVNTAANLTANLEVPVAIVGHAVPLNNTKFQYGTARNAVLESPETAAAVLAMAAENRYPYVAIQDFDTGARSTPANQHIFNRMQQLAQGRNQSLPPSRPLMMAGGYRVGDPTTLRSDMNKRLLDMLNRNEIRQEQYSAAITELNTNPAEFYHRFSLAIQHDMQTRDRQATQHPLLPYAPEPNLFIDGLLTAGNPDVRFGDGGAEYGKLSEALNQAFVSEVAADHGHASADDMLNTNPDLTSKVSNNQHPERETAFLVDFQNSTVPTDLSRLATTFLLTGSLPQTHASLATPVDRLYASKSAKSGVSISGYTNANVTKPDPFVTPRKDNWAKGLPQKVAAQLGGLKRNRLSPAISLRSSDGTAAGIGDYQKHYVAWQVGVSNTTNSIQQEFTNAHALLNANPQLGVHPNSLYSALAAVSGNASPAAIRAQVLDPGNPLNTSTQTNIVEQRIAHPYSNGHFIAAAIAQPPPAVQVAANTRVDPAEQRQLIAASNVVTAVAADRLGVNIAVHSPNETTTTFQSPNPTGTVHVLRYVDQTNRLVFRPPVDTGTIDALRGTVPPRQTSTTAYDAVHTGQTTGTVPAVVAQSYQQAGSTVPNSGTMTRPTFNHVDGPIAYQYRALPAPNGATVHDFTVRVHLAPQDATAGQHLDVVQQRAATAINSLYNNQHVIGTGWFHANVEFVDDPAQADTTIALYGENLPNGDPMPGTDQTHWPVNISEHELAHEYGHYLGLFDEGVDAGSIQRVFNSRNGSGHVRNDNSIMATTGPNNTGIRQRHIDQIVATATNSLAPDRGGLPSSPPLVGPDTTGVVRPAPPGTQPPAGSTSAAPAPGTPPHTDTAPATDTAPQPHPQPSDQSQTQRDQPQDRPRNQPQDRQEQPQDQPRNQPQDRQDQQQNDDPLAPGRQAYQALQARDPAEAERALADAKTALADDGVPNPPDGMAEAVAGLGPANTNTWQPLVDQHYTPELPAYLTDGTALPNDAQTGPAVGGPEIAAMVQALTHRQGWLGLDVVQRAADNEVPSLTGGRHAAFIIHHDGKPYELRLTARPRPGDARHWRPGSGDASAKTTVSKKDSYSTQTVRDHTASAPLSMAMPPGVSATLTPALSTAPNEKTGDKLTGQATSSASTKIGDTVQTDVPVDYELSIVDAQERPVHAANGAPTATATAMVPMQLPSTIGTHPTLGDTLDRALNGRGADLTAAGITQWNHGRPIRPAFEAVTLHPSGTKSFADQILDTLGEPRPAVGSAARGRLQAFAAKLGDPDQVAAMTAWDPADREDGWTSSEALPGRNRTLWTGKARKVQMRLVPRFIRVDGTRPGTEHGFGTGQSAGIESTHTLTRTAGGTAMAGPAILTGAVNATAGPQIGYTQTNEHSVELKQSTGSEHIVNLPADGVRYQVAFEVQVRTLGGTPRALNGFVSAALWSHPKLAPGATPDTFHTGEDRQYFGPAEFEHGDDSAVPMIDLSGHNDLYDAVSAMLRDVPLKRGSLNQDMFIRQFGDPGLGTALSAKIAAVLERGQQLHSALSEPELRALRRTIAGPGLYLPVTHHGRLHDHTTVLLVRSSVDHVADGPSLTVPDQDNPTGTRDPLPSKDKTEHTTSTKLKGSRTHAGQFSGTGRVTSVPVPQAPAGAAGIRVDGRIGRDASTTLETKQATEIQHGETLSADGKLGGQQYRQFQADVHLQVDVLAYQQRNAAGRRMLPARPGRQVPTFQRLTRNFPITIRRGEQSTRPVVRTHTTTLRARYLVPESMVDSQRPTAPTRSAARPAELPNPPTPMRLAPPNLPGGRHSLDSATLLGFSGAAAVHDVARGLLYQVTGGDPITLFPEADLTTKLQRLASPDRIMADRHRYSQPTVVTSTYQRFRDDLTTAVGMTLTPSLADTPISHAEWQQASQKLESALAAEGSRHWKATIAGYVTGTFSGKLGTATGGHADTTGSGVLIATVGPTGEVSGSHTVLAGSSQQLTVGHEAEKVYLARVSHVATVVAEAQRKGNLDWMELFARPAPTRAGATIALPGTDLVWLTESQLAALRGTDTAAPAPQPNGPVRTLPRPVSLDQSRVAAPSMGLGGIVDPVDATAALDDIRAQLTQQLGTAADALLPPDTVSSGVDTHQSLTNLLSTLHHQGSNLLNGGATAPVRQEFRWRGHTFQATVDATFTPGRARHVAHEAKFELSQTATLSTSDTSGSARTIASYSVAGRFSQTSTSHADAATPGGNPATGGAQAGLQVAGQAGRRSGSSTTSSETAHEQSISIAGPVGKFGGTLTLTVRLQHGDDPAAAVVNSSSHVTLTGVTDTPLPAPRNGQYGRSDPSRSVDTTDPAQWVAANQGTPLPGTGNVYGEHFYGRVDELVQTATDTLRSAGVTVNGKVRAQLRAGITASALKAGLPEMSNTPLRVPVPGSRRVLDIYATTPGAPRYGGVTAGITVDGKTTVKAVSKADQDTGHITQISGTAMETAGTARHPGQAAHDFDSGTQTIGVNALPYDSTSRTTLTQAGDIESNEAARKTPPDRSAEPLTRTQVHDVRVLMVVRDKPDGAVRAARSQHFTDAYVTRVPDATAAALTGRATPDPLASAARAMHTAGTDWDREVRKLNGLRAAAHATARTRAALKTAHQVAERRVYRARDRYIDAGIAVLHAPRDPALRDAAVHAEAALLEARQARQDLTARIEAATRKLAADRDPATWAEQERAVRDAEQAWWRARAQWLHQTRIATDPGDPRHRVPVPPARSDRPPPVPPLPEPAHLAPPIPPWARVPRRRPAPVHPPAD